jgi:magnesium transporter
MKHALITYLNTLWASWDVINSLRYGDAETITDNQKLLQRIGILGDDINRQIALSEHMSEVLASGLEVLQTIYNNQLQMLNNRLAFIATWLAVLATAGLVPNTLATIFGIGKINDLIDWPWIITILILSTIICTYLMYLLFKKKEWLPPKAEC